MKLRPGTPSMSAGRMMPCQWIELCTGSVLRTRSVTVSPWRQRSSGAGSWPLTTVARRDRAGEIDRQLADRKIEFVAGQHGARARRRLRTLDRESGHARQPESRSGAAQCKTLHESPSRQLKPRERRIGIVEFHRRPPDRGDASASRIERCGAMRRAANGAPASARRRTPGIRRSEVGGGVPRSPRKDATEARRTIRADGADGAGRRDDGRHIADLHARARLADAAGAAIAVASMARVCGGRHLARAMRMRGSSIA